MIYQRTVLKHLKRILDIEEQIRKEEFIFRWWELEVKLCKDMINKTPSHKFTTPVDVAAATNNVVKDWEDFDPGECRYLDFIFTIIASLRSEIWFRGPEVKKLGNKTHNYKGTFSGKNIKDEYFI